MRILGFSKRWDKLNQNEFTTFRVPRKYRDWERGEVVQIVYHPRSKDHEKLGEARIIEKTGTILSSVTNEEATIDGFPLGKVEMWRWMCKSHNISHLNIPLNKLTLYWIKKGNR